MIKEIDLIKFVRVRNSVSHVKALYSLLINRRFNISNQKIPSFSEHRLFVINNPYRAWYLIEVNKSFVGSLYLLKDNCVGIYVEGENQYITKKTIDWVLENKKPLPEIKSLRAPYFHINVSPKNKILRSILHKIKAEPIQVTYSLKNL